MEAVAIDRLAAIERRTYRRHTRYEYVIEAPAGERYLLGYGARAMMGQRGLFAAIRRKGPEIVALTGAESFKPRKGRGLRPVDFEAAAGVPNGWVAYATGRTEREAILEGELERVPR